MVHREVLYLARHGIRQTVLYCAIFLFDESDPSFYSVRMASGRYNIQFDGAIRQYSCHLRSAHRWLAVGSHPLDAKALFKSFGDGCFQCTHYGVFLLSFRFSGLRFDSSFLLS
jgi:hypothetical protein